jgi:hypothetical protein
MVRYYTRIYETTDGVPGDAKEIFSGPIPCAPGLLLERPAQRGSPPRLLGAQQLGVSPCPRR